MYVLRILFALGLSALPLIAAESFETQPVGEVKALSTNVGTWQAANDNASVQGNKGRTGKQSLHIVGGHGKSVILTFLAPANEAQRMVFWAERWTRKGACEFYIEGKSGDSWRLLKREDAVKVGGFDTRVEVEIPAGVSGLRFVCSSDAGILLDDFAFHHSGPMTLTGVTVTDPVLPVLIRRTFNPVAGLTIETDGIDDPLSLEAVEFSLDGTTRPQDIDRIELVPGGASPTDPHGEPLDTVLATAGSFVFKFHKKLAAGPRSFWVSVVLKQNASIDGRIAVSLKRIKIGDEIRPMDAAPVVPKRIGVAIRLQGDDGANSYRIPGLVRTKSGTLVAVYDIRYKNCGDLPGKIDVGISRSKDDGQSWEDMRVAMHAGTMGKTYEADGVGDPAVLVDQSTGRLWLAALWSHGNRSWFGSGPGLTPDETGQLLICHSDDDGKTWSAPQSITPRVKKPEWLLCFQGPGAGMTMKDGTLVFAAQFRSANGGQYSGKPFSTILWSRDHGQTWTIGSGAKLDTTEAQVAELSDGSLMLNCRDNHGGSRTVMVTKDLGKTWTTHATDRSALPEPVCMASFLRWDHPQRGTFYIFSNPASTKGRDHMTLKFSKDDAQTWPKQWHTLYDERSGAGYSCLAPAGNDHIGVLYEGQCELYFLRVSLDECLK